MNIDDLTIAKAKQIAAMFGSCGDNFTKGIKFSIGKKCIVRTFSAGVWFGTIEQKSGNEVILTDARRMWLWFAAQGISLSEVSKYGIVHEKSRISEFVQQVWLEAIEIIPCTLQAIESICGAPNATA